MTKPSIGTLQDFVSRTARYLRGIAQRTRGLGTVVVRGIPPTSMRPPRSAARPRLPRAPRVRHDAKAGRPRRPETPPPCSRLARDHARHRRGPTGVPLARGALRVPAAVPTSRRTSPALGIAVEGALCRLMAGATAAVVGCVLASSTGAQPAPNWRFPVDAGLNRGCSGIRQSWGDDPIRSPVLGSHARFVCRGRAALRARAVRGRPARYELACGPVQGRSVRVPRADGRRVAAAHTGLAQSRLRPDSGPRRPRQR